MQPTKKSKKMSTNGSAYFLDGHIYLNIDLANAATSPVLGSGTSLYSLYPLQNFPSLNPSYTISPEFIGHPTRMVAGSSSSGRPTAQGRPEAPNHRPTVPATIVSQVQSGGEPIEQSAVSRADGLLLWASAIDALEEWKGPEGRTLQLEFGRSAGELEIPVIRSLTLPPTSLPRTFEVLLASHRARCELRITTSQRDNGGIHSELIPFDLSKTGGRLETEYQFVSVDIPPGDCSIEVTLVYKEYTGSVGGLPPYAFVSNPRVKCHNEDSAVMACRTITLGNGQAGNWYWGQVPRFQSDCEPPIRLIYKGGEHELYEPHKNCVRIVENYGHSMLLQSDQPGVFVVYIDGVYATKITLTQEGVWYQVPSDYLKGEVVDVSIRDEAGTQVFVAAAIALPRVLTSEEVMLREGQQPYAKNITMRESYRYRAIQRHLASPVVGMDASSLSTAFFALDLDHQSVKLAPISFPVFSQPKVSIIIPAHNNVRVTYYALCALLVAHNNVSFEVIVVDDGSTDETATLEELVSGIKVVRNDSPERFIRACNRGVSLAVGEYVALLNNDTEVTSGWLDALVGAMNRFPRAGLVGSKLLFPDGRLQEAGGIVWSSGNPWNYGRGANPFDPRFSYARQVDYLSGAALLTTKAIWDSVGGLSSYLEPMYFEDTDLAFKVRALGYQTWFVPGSIVYHFEGVTSGTDLNSGYKRFQEVNRPKFKRAWAREFAAFGKEGEQPDLEKDRGISGRVLFVDYGLPREDHDAGSYAARREIELVQALGYKVTFLPTNLGHLGGYTDSLQESGVEVIVSPFTLSIADFMKARGSEFDAIFVTRYYVAQEILPLKELFAPNAKVIFNPADLHFLRELRALHGAADEARLEHVTRTQSAELDVMKKSDVVLTYNEVEHSVISSHSLGKVRVMKCPWVVQVPDAIAPLTDRRGISFLGGFGHPPNVEGVKWFCSSVIPLLKLGDHKFSIYGNAMKDEIKALASDIIDPAGYLPDVSDAFEKHRVFVAPLLTGAGIKGKVMSALAYGIPVVLTPVAAEGIGLRSGHDCLIATRPDEFAKAIHMLLENDELWMAMSTAAREYMKNEYSFPQGVQKMKAAFEAVDLFS